VAALLVRREGRWLSVTAVVSGLGFWILAGQPLTGLPAFLSNSGALATGYHAAMSTWQPSQAAIWGGLLLCGLPALAVLAAELRRPSFSSVALCGWFLLFEAIVVQQAMARSDRFHLTMGLVSAAWPVALTLLPCPHLWTFATPRHYQKLFALTILLAGCYVCFSILTQPNQQGQLTQTPGMSTEWWNIPRPRAATSAQVSAETVAVFPMDLSYAFQKGYAVRNLPVIQSYAAFSPRLTALNSHFLENDSAPARIYFEVAPIDHRYPTLEDPLTAHSLPASRNGGRLSGSPQARSPAAVHVLADTFPPDTAWRACHDTLAPLSNHLGGSPRGNTLYRLSLEKDSAGAKARDECTNPVT
jgi:hypothetical protein